MSCIFDWKDRSCKERWQLQRSIARQGKRYSRCFQLRIHILIWPNSSITMIWANWQSWATRPISIKRTCIKGSLDLEGIRSWYWPRPTPHELIRWNVQEGQASMGGSFQQRVCRISKQSGIWNSLTQTRIENSRYLHEWSIRRTTVGSSNAKYVFS